MGGDSIGRIIIIELSDQDSSVFDDILSFLNQHSDWQQYDLSKEPILSFPGLEINFARHRIYCNHQEVELTTKEFNILCLLAVNKGRVLTHSQIYEKAWDNEAIGNERKAVGYHIWNIRKKLYAAAPEHKFAIESVREVGYRFEVNNMDT